MSSTSITDLRNMTDEQTNVKLAAKTHSKNQKVKKVHTPDIL